MTAHGQSLSGSASGALVEMPAASLSHLLRRFAVGQWITLAGALLCLAAEALPIWSFGRLRAAVSTFGVGNVPEDSVPDIEDMTSLSTFGDLFAHVVVIVAFFVAMGRARRIAKEAGIFGFDCSFGWTVGAFFIPILNFYRPWIGLAEQRNAIVLSGRFRQSGDEWKNHDGGAGATWALGLFVVGLPILSRVLAGGTIPPPQSTQEFLAWATRMIDSFTLLAALDVMSVLVFFVYLATLSPALKQLVALAGKGALKKATHSPL